MKILTIDIETSPHISAHFGRWKQNIVPDNTLSESRVICFAAKWRGEDDIMFFSEWVDGWDTMILEAHKLLDEADAVVHFNGKQFDIKRLNSEFIYLGLTPPSPFKQIDLMWQCKKNFAFSSNRLQHILETLGLAEKMDLGPNKMKLWIDVCWNELASARSTMQEYNVQDVASTEELYEYLLGWISPHPNWGLYLDDTEDENKPICPNCGSKNLIKKGLERTKVRTYQRWRCKDCGSHHRGRRNVGPTINSGVLM